MRKLPIFFLIDVSESMIGKPIEYVQQGMNRIVKELRNDPYALETAYVSVIAFAGKAKTLVPLQECYKFMMPELPIGGGTGLGVGLELLMKEIDSNVTKTTADKKGDWKPIIFLFTDGSPTDNPKSAIAKWQKSYQRRCNLVVVSIGDNANTGTLCSLTETVLRFNPNGENDFAAMFKWVSGSIAASTRAVSDGLNDDLRLEDARELNLEKVTPDSSFRDDENCVILPGKCAKTKKMYLVKYVKDASSGVYRIDGSYAVEENVYDSMSAGSGKNKVNTGNLMGDAPCPHCSNNASVCVCLCGSIFCCNSTEGEKLTCPWCGKSSTLAFGSADTTRGRG